MEGTMTNEEMRRALAEITELMLVPVDEPVPEAIYRIAKSVIHLRSIVESLVARI